MKNAVHQSSPSLPSLNPQGSRISQPNARKHKSAVDRDVKNRSICNTIHPDDYPEMETEIALFKLETHRLQEQGAVLAIPCEARWWEYGTAMKLAMEFKCDHHISILDVGSGWSALGPVLATSTLSDHGHTVVEYEPERQYTNDRVRVNEILASEGRKQINVHNFGLFDMPPQDYDIVFCISVLEHVHPNMELQGWRELAQRVKPGGILFITTDCLPAKDGPYIFDNLRAWNPIATDFESRIKMMEDFGMKVMGTPDYTYHGNYVHDQYSFFRVGFIKP